MSQSPRIASQCFRASLKEHRFFLLVSLLYAATTFGLSLHFGASVWEILSILGAVLASFSVFLFAIFIGKLAIILWNIPILSLSFKTPAYFIREVEREFSNVFLPNVWPRHLVTLLCVYPFFCAFMVGKSLIPLLSPYSMDPVLSQADFKFHGDHFPHTLLPSLEDSFFVISISEWIYFAWFFIILCMNSFAFFFDENSPRRKAYLWSSLMMWMVFGGIIATLLPSVGPIFYADFYPSLLDPYADLKADFHHAKELGAQMWPATIALLLDFIHNKTVCDLNGISAMPSMHVGASFLACLYGFSIYKPIGILAGLYTLLILASSIILGFHYAIDGYISIIGVALIWIFFRWIFRKKQTPKTII